MTTSTRGHAAGLAYELHGNRNANRVLLLVHGFPLDRSMWKFQLDALSKHCLVVAPDLRGFGGSQPLKTAEPLLMSRHADDLAELLDALELDKPVAIAGLSMGGYVAWEFWRRSRDRALGLALLDTKATSDSAEAQQTRLEIAERALAEGIADLTRGMLSKLVCKKTLEQQPDWLDAIASQMQTTSPMTFAAAQRGMAARTDATDLLAAIDKPCLALAGEHDRISSPEEMMAMASQIVGAEFVCVDDAAHLPALENPSRVNAAMTQWLETCFHE